MGEMMRVETRCTGTLLTSFSHACSGLRFNFVNAAEVS